MIPVLYKVEFEKDEFFKGIKTVFTIHNLYFQGTFTPEILPELFGYDYELFFDGSLELNKKVSFLKGAINYSDKILTVSKSYSEEIKTPEYGEGLHGLLEYRSEDLLGIINGIDYEEYNPETDECIVQTYSINDLNGKGINKERLQHKLGLPINKDIAMIAMISRLTHQKGCDLLISILDRLLQKDIQVVILGTGENIYEEALKKIGQRYYDKMSVNVLFDNTLAHEIYSASDILLMPSLFEPCGLAQMIALRYGVLPIVRETGGLKDTVTSYNRYSESGNGFTFKNYTVSDLMNITEHVLDIYKDKNIWNTLTKQAMKADNSWDSVAYEYKELYELIIGE